MIAVCLLYESGWLSRYSDELQTGRSGFDSGRGNIFLFSIVSRQVPGPTHPAIQWVPGALFLRVKQPGREADRSPLSSAEVKNNGTIHPLPHM
jgi:hypothetical protein